MHALDMFETKFIKELITYGVEIGEGGALCADMLMGSRAIMWGILNPHDAR